MVNDEVFEHISQSKDTPLYLKNACNPNEIFTWDDVERYINNNLHTVDIVSIGGNSQKKNAYTSLLSHNDNRKNLTTEIKNGDSFILNGMERYTKGIFYASNIFSLLQNSHVTTNIYGGLQSSSKSFPAHADPQYVLILQLDGVSDWTIYNELWDGQRETCIIEDESRLTTYINVTVKAGDVLYIPLARYHKCVPKSKRLSASISADYDSTRPTNYGHWYSLN